MLAIVPSFIAAPPRVTPAIGVVLRAVVPLAQVLLATMANLLAGAAPASGDTADLPRFIVPGYESEMGRLEELHAVHHPGAFSTCTLWDAWLPHATLWTGSRPRDHYRRELLARRIDAEGYVSMQQHRGLAHSEGWPFPTWPQAGGTGWHFSMAHDGWAQQVTRIQPLASAEGWDITGADVAGIDPARGLLLTATADTVQITTPAFRCAAFVAPFLRLEWAGSGLAAATADVTWLSDDETDWQATRSVAVDPPGAEMRYANMPLYRHAGHTGTITRYRITLRNARGGEIRLKSLITAIDSRHPITNSLFAIGAADFFCWTGDRTFLREVIGPLRSAIGFSIAEFDVAAGAHVHVRWVGHDGRTGLGRDATGRKQLLRGHGVGNNYWDLLPFGSHDALATMMLHAALLRLAEIEETISTHPGWEIPAASAGRRGGDLRDLADRIRADFQERFWSPATGRFVGWIDADGTPHDYGFTFLNLEAIARGLASPVQAGAILDWIDGRRTVAGDTAQGDDIYHWRFGPRSTTRRNIETYMWAWANPESIPWGGQVQDGGAVLGFSYFELLARLEVSGPDDAWRRLREILAWFGEVQEAGGYRAYYAVPGRGTLQGGGTAGGLGFDHEFMESVLVPQVMLYGFLGFRPTPEGFALRPQLPGDWPVLKITGVHVHDHVLDIEVFRDGSVLVQPVRGGAAPLVIEYAATRHVRLPGHPFRVSPAGAVEPLAH